MRRCRVCRGVGGVSDHKGGLILCPKCHCAMCGQSLNEHTIPCSDRIEQRRGPKVAYMCGVAWQHDLGNDEVKLYASERSCLERESCVDECGVAEVHVTFVRWAKPQKLRHTKRLERK